MATLVIDKQYTDGGILYEAMLDAAFASITTFVNTGQISAENIQDNSIGPSELQTNSITTDKIANNAVTTNKIADGAVTLAKLAANIIELIGTPGEIAAYGGDAAPAGWLLCDGSAVSRSTYSVLYSTVGDRFGNGDGATTFNLPDFRGRFLRGVDGAAGRDPDAATRAAMNTGGNTGNNVGSVQTDAMQDHRHDYSHRVTVQADVSNTFGSNTPVSVATQTSYASARNVADGTRTSTETRPKNAYVNFIIKV